MNSLPKHLILTGFPGWFGNRFIELLLTGGFDQALPLPWDHITILVEPSRFSLAQHLLAQLSRNNSRIHVDIIPVDLSSSQDMHRLSLPSKEGVLVHAAGMIHPQRPQAFTCVNVDGTRHLFELAQRHVIKKAVLISSNSPFGGNPTPLHRFTETSPYVPYMGYGRSKMEAELLAKHWAAISQASLTILRPCWFFGPHQPARQARFFEMIRQGKTPLVRGASFVRSITFVDDLCQATVRALAQTSLETKTYWIALEQSYSFGDIISTIRYVLEEDFHLPCQRRTIPIPTSVATVARITDAVLQTAGAYHQEIHVLGELGMHISCSIEAAKQELGFVPTPSLRDVVRPSLAWSMAHGQISSTST